MQTNVKGWKHYHTVWLLLLLGWTVSAADRAVTGPIVTWMIENKVSFLMAAEHPHALGGLVGSLFFTGYMLTQFPGGYYGDRFGHRRIITISLFVAAITTVVSGFMSSLIGFVALRVLTGLGEGVYYANDRTLITEVTPFEKRSLGMGVVITGLALGVTFALLLPPYLIRWGNSLLGDGQGWRMVFFAFGIVTLIVAVVVSACLKNKSDQASYRDALIGLGKYNILFFLAILGVFFIADQAGLPSWGVAVIELVLCFMLVGFAYIKKGTELSKVLRDRSLVIMYIGHIAILWNLWFFSFWSVSIISEAANTSFLQAALTATFNGVAGIIGFPAGGWLADYALRKNWGRKVVLVWFILLQGITTLIFGIYLINGGKSAFVMGTLIFVASLFFNAMQPIYHAIIADLSEPNQRGATFGMANLVGEIGAVLSPAVSGTLRDATNSWSPAVFLDAAIILSFFVLVLFVKERRVAMGQSIHQVIENR
ncbi:MFS transporter [Polycladomyces sp. WAk]|uniref:MFS transporter n=1 Tax=Polycladomyces zharkentensis TaxID=2807616 RepID=A0ABS2WN09_9BACL|nr:MFS transporter [Polycladomyces sp. WAk]MBN2910856.1 MFS transporter [Polycladomyces sp. WAk]